MRAASPFHHAEPGHDQVPRSSDDIPHRLGEDIPPKPPARPDAKSRLRVALVIVAITAVITILLTLAISFQQPIR